ncbi:cytochrome P450 [Neolewinella agarilytica]|uniref:cytochrome P450 n=1 Tax=Neolewinella agarilytica TaxID=478744 RepID=UPI0023556C5B|nr:cytochrome P450 [Neolewinella agarilytica]
MILPPKIPLFEVLRNLPQMASQPIDVFTGYIEKYGRNFILKIGASRLTHFTVDAELIRHVLQRNNRNYEKSEIQTTQLARFLGKGLLTNSGKDWLKQRRLIQPGFHRQRLEALTQEMQGVINQQCEKLNAAATGGQAISLHEFTRGAVFRIIVRAIFTDGFTEEESRELNEAIDAIQHYVIYPVRMPFLRAPLRWLGKEAKYQAISQEIHQKVLQRIQERRKGLPKDDLLQMLLDSRYEDNGEPMNDEQIADEIKILFAAGHETSANALAWTIWLLLRHPPELDKVRSELAAAAASGPIDFAGVRRLPYTTQVIEESMRLYPPAWITDRVALADDHAAGFDIARGTVVGIFFQGLHRSPEYWQNPDQFLPQRMSPEAKKERHPFAFLPFGGGPRLCIGNHFAMLEMLLVLASVLGKYDFELPPNADAIGNRANITLGMDRELLVKVKHRVGSQG